MDSSIFLPLGSNASWFETEKTVAMLEGQLKTSLMLYDKVVLENGRYQMTAGDDGQGMTHNWPAESYPGDRREFSFYEKGREFSIALGDKVVLKSRAEIAFEVDFCPIVAKAGINDDSCVEWCSSTLTQGFSNSLKSQASNDLMQRRFSDYLPENRYFRKELIFKFYFDLCLAQALKLPVLMSAPSAKLAYGVDRVRTNSFRHAVKSVAFDVWQNLDLPDFSNWDWDEVLRFRNSANGVEFRKMINRICNEADLAYSCDSDVAAVQDIIRKNLIMEIINELKKRRKNSAKLGMSLMMNFVPFSPFVSGGKELLDLAAENRSWVSIFSRG